MFFVSVTEKSLVARPADECASQHTDTTEVVKDGVPLSVICRDETSFWHLNMDVIGPLFEKAEYNDCLCLIDC